MHYARENCPCWSYFGPVRGRGIRARQRLSTTQDDIYCSGTITSESVPHDTFLITGEESNYKITFQEGDYVYINKGSGQGVKVGDEFSVIRAVVRSYRHRVDQVAVLDSQARWARCGRTKAACASLSRSPDVLHRPNREFLRLHAARRYRAAVSISGPSRP